MTAPEDVQPPLMGQVRTAADRLMVAYASRGAVGPDAYWQEAVYHPMADAKFLLGISALHRTRLLSDSRFAEHASAALERLHHARSKPVEGAAAWGLGFPWKGSSAEEPYLITSVLVAEALLDVALEAARPLLVEFGRFLQWMAQQHSTTVNGIRLPYYSPQRRLIAWNVVARWGAVCDRLSRVVPDLLLPATAGIENLLWSRRFPPAGWPYSDGHMRFDLLHQCYVLGALRHLRPSHPDLDDALFDTFHVFSLTGQFDDKMDYVPRPEAFRRGTKGPSLRTVPLRDGALIVHRAPARLWSLGELVGVCADASAANRMNDYEHWSRFVASELLHRLSSNEPSLSHPRESMHAFHGLARLLEAARG